MKIFENYIGNAMLNNALMTIEALGSLKDVTEITPTLLLTLYNEKNILKLNKRLKSYTMLFTKNGPLHNDKTNGDKFYDALFKSIIDGFENEGTFICEISGLRFNTSFNKVYINALRNIGVSEKEIQNKDTNISRTWFPLIGGLGSDAQALPQAKFTVQIHPICIAILQFLPLSSLLYKGGILLIDSSNFVLMRQYIAENLKELSKRIEKTKSTDPIENFRDFAKGNYILKAIEILESKNEFEESYSDLNLWSFSNSGTGASCEIDRVPNTLIQKLINLKKTSPSVDYELRKILNHNNSAYSFLNALEANEEWWLLYPNVFGTGKKRVDYEGLSLEFLEAYFKETGNINKVEYAKYLAFLISKYKTKSFEKYLEKTDAWNEKEYRIDLFAVLVTATKNGEWNLFHQLAILDNPKVLPVRNTYYRLHKLIHFYFQKNEFVENPPKLIEEDSYVKIACKWLIKLIQKDEKCNSIINDLANKQEYTSVTYFALLVRSYELPEITLQVISNTLYNENFYNSKNGLNELLRIFFNQPEQLINVNSLNLPGDLLLVDSPTQKWFDWFYAFSVDYQAYYFNKYKHRETEAKPYKKFEKQVKDIPMETSHFLMWFREATELINDYLKSSHNLVEEKWSDDLLYNPQGEFSISFSKLAVKLSLLKHLQYSINTNQILIS